MNALRSGFDNFSRRDGLKAAAFVGAAATLAGCEDAVSRVSTRLGQRVPDRVAVADGAEIDPAHHLISRAGFGPWPGDVDRIHAMGTNAWVEEQLAPESINDVVSNLRAEQFNPMVEPADDCYEYDKDVLRQSMSRHSLLHAVYSKRQLFEVMVSFWTDHLNINIEKSDCMYLKPSDDREVIRKNALGKFRDLIRASATSPAMLVYLDGKENHKANPQDVPNENYGRELMELHTLGVNGGYTQKDVLEVARCLTGWKLGNFWSKSHVHHEPSLHDNGEKLVLGQRIPAAQGGEKDLEQVIDIVTRHPSTARHVAKKLVQRFVSEEPPASLVERVAKVFTDTDGQIKPLVRTILTSDEFNASAGQKFKPPFRFVVSALRAVGADTHAHDPLIDYLSRMGQGVFQYPTPDGYPDESAPWMGTLLWRWNLGFALAANQVPSVKAPLDDLTKALGITSDADAPKQLLEHFGGRKPNDAQLRALAAAAKTLEGNRDLIALSLASPGFQRY